MFRKHRQAFVALLTFALFSSFLLINGQSTTSTTTTTTTTPKPSTNSTTNSTTSSTTNSTTGNETTTTTTTAKPVPRNNDCGCLNNGVCQADGKTCKCAANFYGSRCQLVVCNSSSSSEKSKSANKQATDVMGNLTSLQCSKNGYCMRDTQTDEFECKCNPGHTGALCERPSCLDYCYNGGACTDGLGTVFQFELETDKIANLSCLCPPGGRFYGARCEFDKCFVEAKTCNNNNNNNRNSTCWLGNDCKCNCDDQCDATYCNKMGKCVLNGSSELGCKCNVGYSGRRCVVDNCVGFCFNEGKCNRNNETYFCNCTENFNGTRCEHQIRKLDPSASTQSPRKSSSVPHVVYGLSVVVIICLCLVGVYLLIQKGFFDGLNIEIMNRVRGYTSSQRHSSSSGATSTGTNMFFNKLEDEQAIVHSEIA